MTARSCALKMTVNDIKDIVSFFGWIVLSLVVMGVALLLAVAAVSIEEAIVYAGYGTYIPWALCVIFGTILLGLMYYSNLKICEAQKG